MKSLLAVTLALVLAAPAYGACPDDWRKPDGSCLKAGDAIPGTAFIVPPDQPPDPCLMAVRRGDPVDARCRERAAQAERDIARIKIESKHLKEQQKVLDAQHEQLMRSSATPALLDSQLQPPEKGGSLYSACTSASGSIGDKLCQSYINGFVNGLLAAEANAAMGTPICVPEHVDTRQAREVVVRFFAANPAAQYLDAGPAVGVALQQVWPGPCKG